MAWIDGIAGVLLDIDGTLLRGDEAIPGAVEAVSRIRSRQIPFRCVTNTTRRPRSEIAAVLTRAGLAIDVREILVPAALARRRIVDSGRRRALLLVAPAVVEDLADVERVDAAPDWVVVGDLGSGFTWETLNRAFRCLHAGAALLALQKNRYWHAGPRQDVCIDAGAIVAALEFAAEVRAEVVGKPSPEFYRLALEELGVAPAHAVMVGDDFENDCVGARAVGCRTAMVRTGKFSDAKLESSAIRPDLVVDSVASLDP